MTIFGLLDLALTVDCVLEVKDGKFFTIAFRTQNGIEYLECTDPPGTCGKKQWSLFLPLEERYINKAYELLEEKIRHGHLRKK